MRLQVIDGNGELVTIIAQSVEVAADKSALLTSGAAQALMAANENRAGWFFQNVSTHDMYVNDLGADAKAVPTVGDGSFKVAAGATFPPAGWPVSVTAISVIGTNGDAFVAREW